MKRIVAVVAILTLALAGCNKNRGASSGTTNPNTSADMAAAQNIVSGCMTKGNVLTHTGRQAILACMAPPGHEAAFQNCASGQLAHANLFSKPGRAAFEQALAVCLEQNR